MMFCTCMKKCVRGSCQCVDNSLQCTDACVKHDCDNFQSTKDAFEYEDSDGFDDDDDDDDIDDII